MLLLRGAALTRTARVGLGDEKILLGSLVQNVFRMEEEVPKGISPEALGSTCACLVPRTPNSDLHSVCRGAGPSGQPFCAWSSPAAGSDDGCLAPSGVNPFFDLCDYSCSISPHVFPPRFEVLNSCPLSRVLRMGVKLMTKMPRVFMMMNDFHCQSFYCL